MGDFNYPEIDWHTFYGQSLASHKFVGGFLANVNSSSRSLYAVARPLVCRSSV